MTDIFSNETSLGWTVCDAVDSYRAPRSEGDERTLQDFLAEKGIRLVPAEPAAWLYEMAHYIKPSDQEPFKDWRQVITIEAPPTIPKDGVRNVTPLYASLLADLRASSHSFCPTCKKQVADPCVARQNNVGCPNLD